MIIKKLKKHFERNCNKCSISPMCETFIMLEENNKHNLLLIEDKGKELAQDCDNYTTKKIKSKEDL